MMMRQALLAMAGSDQLKTAVAAMPISSGIVSRFIAGESIDDAVRSVQELSDHGLRASMDHLGEDTRDREQAAAAVSAYLDLFDALHKAELTDKVEASVKLSAVGQSIGTDGDRIALDNARSIAQAARNVGTTITIDMEDHTTTDRTLDTVRELRQDFPDTGAVLQSYLHRTESDCADLAGAGSRVRLCKGAYNEPRSVAYQARHDVDLSYVRCLKALFAGDGYPMVATHDPRMVDIAAAVAERHGRDRASFEFQMLYGMRPEEQERLAGAGHTVRVYVPYGQQWYGYMMRRLAERPANVAFFARSLVTKS